MIINNPNFSFEELTQQISFLSISTICVNRNVSKYTYAERELIKDIVASLTIKRVPEPEILAEVYRQTNKTLSHSGLYRVKELIKKESFKWYTTLRNSHYEYLHEFKERINEIYWLQQKHHEIIKHNEHNPNVQQASLNELHKLNITLANYFDILPDIINGSSIPTTPQDKTIPTETESIITV